MRFSKKTEYALRALIHAARFPEGTSFQIRELAEKNGIPKKFLELILLELKNAGILTSRRGVGGGYLLARRPETIRSTEIIQVIEGPLVAADAGETSASPVVARLMDEASRAVATVLNGWTLADLAREEQEAAERKARNIMYFI